MLFLYELDILLLNFASVSGTFHTQDAQKSSHQIWIQIGEWGNCMHAALPNKMVSNGIFIPSLPLLQCMCFYPSLIWIYQPQVLNTVRSVKVFDFQYSITTYGGALTPSTLSCVRVYNHAFTDDAGIFLPH